MKKTSQIYFRTLYVKQNTLKLIKLKKLEVITWKNKDLLQV